MDRFSPTRGPYGAIAGKGPRAPTPVPWRSSAYRSTRFGPGLIAFGPRKSVSIRRVGLQTADARAPRT